MSYFAAMLVRADDQWKSADIELDELGDIDEIADAMRDAAADDGSVLLFVEQDDEWFAIVRVDGVGEPRVFISDARVVGTSQLAATVFQDEVPEEVLEDVDSILDEDAEVDEEEEPVVRPDAEPRGATDLLADFGMPAGELLELCAEEGMLPADVISAACERLGCAEEIEVYR
ncbi:MAG: hypothetical protein QOJ62_2340 [Actinomycetota bacterium]|nr:hypothetical protein [Actinomycetota bacterium]